MSKFKQFNAPITAIVRDFEPPNLRLQIMAGPGMWLDLREGERVELGDRLRVVATRIDLRVKFYNA